MAVMLAVSSQSVAADWEMLPDSEFCIARNGIDWGNGNIGETRFGWVDDKLYLSAINDKWNVNASEEKPFQSVGEADFDGVRVPVMVYSQESTTVIVELDGSVENLDIIVNSKSMKIYPVGDYRNLVFGYELDEEFISTLLSQVNNIKKPTLDQILDKINTKGYNCLTPFERDTLENYSKN